MINFASLFGSFNRGTNSAINDLLEKPETTLDQLLDIQTFPNEYKSGNNKILEYMKYPKYQALVSYVTVQGPADNQKKGYKFPMVASEILSVQNGIAIDYFLPDGQIQLDTEYESAEQIQIEVDDNDQKYLLTQETTKQEEYTAQVKAGDQANSQNQGKQANQEEPQPCAQQENKRQEKAEKKKKKKIIKQSRVVKKMRKQKRQPLMTQLLSYYSGPINYTLAGYNCKVLTTLFAKKPANFFNFIFRAKEDYVELLCNHVESKSVGDLISKLLVWESADFVDERKRLYDHLLALMSSIKESHIISNLAYTINQIIEKTSTYIKTKVNISNNQQVINAYLKIFYRTQQVHKIITNAMADDQNRSGYNCLILHAYLHHTEIETFNSFKLEQVLQAFIVKASAKLRDIPNRRTLGMGRVKIVEIFSFLIRKQKKTIQDDVKHNEISGELLQELYIHSLVANVTDFFAILIKLVQSFENNNILHNEVFRIMQSVLKEPQQNGSILQELLLNDQNVLLKFIVAQAEKDKQIKNAQKHTKRKGYIGHVIKICRLIDQIENNDLLNQRIKQDSQFRQVFDTMVAADIAQTNKNLAGYEMKKNPIHQIMFQKQDILSAYAVFLNHCPKPQFQPEQMQSFQDQALTQPISLQAEQQKKQDQLVAEKQLLEQQRDQQKFNQIVAISEEVDESNPKFWITHMNYDLDKLMQDVL